MMRKTFVLVAALALSACSTNEPIYFASEVRVSRADADATCRESGAHVAGLDDVDAVLAACRDSLDSGPCWVDLSSSEADYAITLDGHLMAVSRGFGEALVICEVKR